MSELQLKSPNAEVSVPMSAASLPGGAALFVWSAREWLAAAREQRCIKRGLIPRYHAAECVDAIVLLDEMMCLLAVSALRPIRIGGSGTSALSEDETRLVQSLRAVQRADDGLARQLLAEMMPTPFNQTFLRPARLYVSALCAAGLAFTGARHLTAVEGVGS